MGNLEKAEHSYRRSLEQDPGRTTTHANLAGTLRDLGRAHEAQAAYESAIASAPDGADAADLFHNLASLYLAGGRRAEALSSLRRATALGSKHAESYLALSRLLESQKNSSAAAAALAPLLDPGFATATSQDYTRAGITLFRLDRIEEASSAYEKALLLDGDNTVARINLGWNHHLAGRSAAAEKEFRRVLSVDANGFAQFNLALVLLVRGDVDGARTAFAEEAGVLTELRELARSGRHGEEAAAIIQSHWSQ